MSRRLLQNRIETKRFSYALIGFISLSTVRHVVVDVGVVSFLSLLKQCKQTSHLTRRTCCSSLHGISNICLVHVVVVFETTVTIRAVWCSVVQCGVVWCGVVQCGAVWCSTVWCSVVQCGAVWCSKSRHRAWPLLCNPVLGVVNIPIWCDSFSPLS
jgi:hypothetical protein